jgi:hypothetical protein
LNIPLIIAIVFFVGIVDVAIIWLVIRSRRSKTQGPPEHYVRLAEDLDLTLTGGELMFPRIKLLGFLKKPYRLQGAYRACTLQIYEYTVSSNNSSTTYTTCRIETPNPRKLTFQFTREGAMTKMGKMLGLQDIDIGDPHFDKTFRTKCNDADFIKGAMIDSVKEQFYALWENHGAKGSIILNKQQFGYQETGRIKTEQDRLRITAAVELVATLGGVVKYYNHTT